MMKINIAKKNGEALNFKCSRTALPCNSEEGVVVDVVDPAVRGADRSGRASVKIGYARVSTDEQNLSLQIDALHKAGCEVLYSDRGISGASFSRPGLDEALGRVTAGDTLVVWRLDRLGRSLLKIVDLIQHLGRQQVGFVSLSELIDTSSAGGTLMLHIMAAMGEFERNLISERTRAGVAAAKARGIRVGRKPSLSECQRQEAISMLASQPVHEVAKAFNVAPRTIQRLRQARSGRID
jgi:DNA invertase Pin-like site-specific DNA recombinase